VLSNLGAGPHVIQVSYQSDSYFEPSNAADTNLTVAQSSTTTGLTSSAPSAAIGSTVTFTASVVSSVPGSIPAGTISLIIDGIARASTSLDTSGQAIFMVTFDGSQPYLSEGSHSVYAKYIGNTNTAASDSSGSTITQVIGRASNTVLSASSGSPAYGQDLTFTATVSPAVAIALVPGGSVTFFVNGVNSGTFTLDGAGQASITLTRPSAGTYSVQAVYNGDSSFAASSANLSRVVSAAPTTLSLSTSSSFITQGQSVRFTAVVSSQSPTSGTPDGVVNFYIDNALVASIMLGLDGVASFSTSGLSVGGHTIKAVFASSGNFVASSASVSESVGRQPGRRT
jgi:hypothetical protein